MKELIKLLYWTSIKFIFLQAILFIAGSLSNVQAQSSKISNAVKSQWVWINSQGKLSYKTLKDGDRIMDFSFAGYMGGGVSMPFPPVKITISPSAGDNTDAIQNAIDEVSRMQMVNGFRGAVLLNAGNYNCERGLTIKTSGVVLRGSGSGSDGSIINMTGQPHTCISVRGKQAGLRLTVFDLLNENKSITRNVEQNYVEDVRTEVLNRYFLISFTYHLKKFKGKLPRRNYNNERRNNAAEGRNNFNVRRFRN